MLSMDDPRNHCESLLKVFPHSIATSEYLSDDPLFFAARCPYEEPRMRHDLGHMDVKCQWCGALHWMNEKLSDSSTSHPMFGMCCNGGKVILPVLRDPPQALKVLFEYNDPQAKEFRENIWKYNRAFAFTSLQVNEDHTVNERRRGLPVFRIQGELRHRGGPLFPAADHPPTYAQLYFYNSQAALEHRRQQNSGLNRETLRILQEILLSHHQYAHIYCHAYNILQHYDSNNDTFIRLRVAPGHDHRRYNLPTADEVAVILPGVDGGDTNLSQCDIILHTRMGGLQIINDLHPAYVPLYYVLLFPYGKNGWHSALKLRSLDNGHTVAKRLTQTRYVAYRLQVRE